MRKIILLVTIFFISLLTLSVWAMPARHIVKTVSQLDGTQLKVVLVGDEHFHCLMTEEGVAVQLDTLTGYYLPVDTEYWKTAKAQASVRRQQINQSRAARLSSRIMSKAAFDEPTIGERHPISGNKKGLVILVNFKDLTMHYSKKDFEDQFNTKGYNKNGHIGSVKDFFYDQSYGQLDIDFDVVGPVTVSQNYAYYGKNKLSTGTDAAPAEMIAEACKLADSMVDFRQYDWDGDGEVDQVYVIYAGYGESNGAPASTIWPHEYDLYSANYYGEGPGRVKLDGVWINTYACSYELEGTSGEVMAVIGSACHEFSHCLGLRDAYDTDYDDNGIATTMANWSLMSGGSYNGPKGLGEVPAGLTAYERWTAGWLELEELSAPCVVNNMPNLLESPRAYVIYNDGNRHEAYILENRQNSSWFSYPLNAHGLLIYHIDYEPDIWFNNKINSESSHPRCTIVPASGTFGSMGASSYAPTPSQHRGHTWPGSTNNRALTDDSKPAATLFQMNSDRTYKLGKPIEQITEIDGKISFLFRGGINLDVPRFNTPFVVSDGKIHLSWTPVADATHYELKITDSSVLLSESMNKMLSNSVSNDNIAGNLDKYMSVAGWTGTQVYQGQNGVRLGSSSYGGSLVSPALNVEGTITVTVTLSKFSDRDRSTGFLKLSRSASKTDSDNLLSSVSFNLSTESQTFQLTNATNPCFLHILPAQRAYVKDLVVVSGSPDDHSERIVQEVSGTSYELPVEDASCTVMVRACSGIAKSAWSEAAILSEETAIEELNAPGISVQGTFDLWGRRIKDFSPGMKIRQGKITIQRY